jgi:hypothetical protein
MPEARPHEETVLAEDVDEIIGLAAKHTHLDPEKLTITELVEIGAELGIKKEAVERAAAELETRRAAERAEAERTRVARAKRARVVGVASAVVVVVMVIASWIGHASLTSALGDVDRARSQVANVIARREDVEKRVAGAAIDPRDKDAELAGAENRVAIEKRRYDEAAERYNARAATFPNDVWRIVFAMPAHVPYSRESSSW